MKLVHDDDSFGDLLEIVANAKDIAVALVEKDYWVTHTLWALQHAGFELWFKGSTSLSKGFGLIERFSEDLDLRIEPGKLASISAVSNWRSDGAGAVEARRRHFTALAAAIVVPGATVTLEPASEEAKWRGAEIRVAYPGRHLARLGVLSPFVRVEAGFARVTPAVARDMTSFVHDHLARIGQLGDFEDNRPKALRCVHPLVTLIEKLDAIRKRYARGTEPAAYVRHYEDAARIVAAATRLDPLDGYDGVAALAEEMQRERQIADLPRATDPSLNPDTSEAWRRIRNASAAIAPMYWGQRNGLDACCAQIRAWIDASLSG